MTVQRAARRAIVAALAAAVLAGSCADAPIPDAELPIGMVDRPQPNAIVKPMPLVVGGWAIGPMGISEVEVYLGDDLKGVTRPAVARPDVRQALPDLAGDTDLHGWNVEIEVGAARGPQTIRIRVRDREGRVADLATVPIVIEPW